MRLGDWKAELSTDFDRDLDCFRGGDGDRFFDGERVLLRSAVLFCGDGVRVSCLFFLSEFDTVDLLGLDLVAEFFSREYERR